MFFRTGHWNLRRFVETGGMPSSHAASVAALSTEVAFHEGVRSILFGVTLYFSLVVMYDAAGLRRAAGRHGAAQGHCDHPRSGTPYDRGRMTPYEAAAATTLRPPRALRAAHVDAGLPAASACRQCAVPSNELRPRPVFRLPTRPPAR